MKKRMKPKYLYVVTTEYGDTEEVRWNGRDWTGLESGRTYDESEFITYTKLKGTEKEKEKE